MSINLNINKKIIIKKTYKKALLFKKIEKKSFTFKKKQLGVVKSLACQLSPPSSFCQGLCLNRLARLGFFYVFLARAVIRPNFFENKIQITHCLYCPILMTEKTQLMVFSTKKPKFQPIFYSKHLQNIIDNMINSFVVSKNQKKIISKPKINSKQKILKILLRSDFLKN